MSFKGKIALVTLSGAIVIYAFAGSLLSTFAQQPINDAGAQMRIFASVLQHIQNDYVDEPNWDKVRAGALRGLPYGLDPYSSYLTEDQVKDFQNNKSAKLAGIGAEFSQVSSYLYVISVVKDSPAEKGGVKSGDVIEYIESKATRDISLYDARQLLLGDAGSQVKLRVLRSNEKPQTLTVTRGSYKIPQVESRVEAGKIGVIKVHSLEEGESEDIKTQLQNLSKQGVQKVVLDLRGVAAGTLKEAVAAANLFVREGNIAQVLGREGKVLETFAADPAKTAFSGPLSVVIDDSTAGPGEVVAAAILESKRGEVVGEKSFGAGTEQQLFTMKRGDGLLLTVRKWASPSGRPFLGGERANSGVKPSVEVKGANSSDLDVEDIVDQNQEDANPQPAASPGVKPEQVKTAEDPQLKKAIELLAGKN